ncbi:sugar transporter ERD6-like 6 [Maniola jurtina]|uniref:sugar transporter ERD6-like 6 n=1 Tax=Maniola jurtina TaxID=191418 RepID=UPI001E688765|nr:sugar transporter ERD6-like 6 [Maniola jurtina]
MFHKFFAIASLNWISLSNGFVFGQVASVVSSLQKREDGIDLTEGQISLIASTLTIMCMVGFALAAIATDKLGRRWPFTIFSIIIIINWIVLYYAKNMLHLMVSRVLGGVSVGGLVVLIIFVTAEYVPPNTRAFHLNMATTVASAIGTSLAHIVGISLHWRNVALFGILPAFISVFLPYFWVESPHWLASKGRFEESQTAFRKLHGKTEDTERELSLLIKMEQSKSDMAKETTKKSTVEKLLIILKRKSFWEPFILSLFMHAYLAASGKLVFSTLAPVMLEQITGKSDVLLFTLLVDGFLFVGACLSCFFIMRTNIRTLLFTTGFTANVILVIFSGLYYFRNGETYFDWINVSLLAFYFIIINTGPYPLLEALYGEIFPLELKVYIFAISGSILMIAFSLTIFLLPFIVSAIGYHGLFLMNAAIMTVSLGSIWLRLPETKGKTLQEIEVYFKAKTFDIEEVLSNEQAKALI